MAGSLTDTHRLSNGVEIPILGFGTWQTPDGDTARDCVKAALDAGYRHIDTAWVYGNEISVGEGIRASGVNRGDIFLTTKHWVTERLSRSLPYPLALRGEDISRLEGD